jgi:hypothetical protein
MVTQGFDYNSAVEYVYTHDPMAAAVYTLYGVDLYRQTDDGSTYIYDPIQGQEIRTLEVKDPNFGDIGPELLKMAAIAVVTAGMGDYFANMYADAGLSATSVGGSTAGAITHLPVPQQVLPQYKQVLPHLLQVKLLPPLLFPLHRGVQ